MRTLPNRSARKANGCASEVCYSRAPGRDRYVFAAEREDCRSCPQQHECCPGIEMSKHGRTVSVEVIHPAVEAFDSKMQTNAGIAIYKQRAPVAEFPHAWIKRK